MSSLLNLSINERGGGGEPRPPGYVPVSLCHVCLPNRIFAFNFSSGSFGHALTLTLISAFRHLEHVGSLLNYEQYFNIFMTTVNSLNDSRRYHRMIYPRRKLAAAANNFVGRENL